MVQNFYKEKKFKGNDRVYETSDYDKKDDVDDNHGVKGSKREANDPKSKQKNFEKKFLDYSPLPKQQFITLKTSDQKGPKSRYFPKNKISQFCLKKKFQLEK